jgi:hypothetical protein
MTMAWGAGGWGSHGVGGGGVNDLCVARLTQRTGLPGSARVWEALCAWVCEQARSCAADGPSERAGQGVGPGGPTWSNVYLWERPSRGVFRIQNTCGSTFTFPVFSSHGAGP